MIGSVRLRFISNARTETHVAGPGPDQRGVSFFRWDSWVGRSELPKEKNEYWASCQQSCDPGQVSPNDDPDRRERLMG